MLRNSFPLTIRVEDFNLIARKPQFLSMLRNLTLHPRSGMNFELNELLQRAKTRKVNCKVITAHHHREIVGWALLSREDSHFAFPTGVDYHATMGTLFQVFVNPAFRRKGIGTTLIKAAKKKNGSSKLCICPWDENSRDFYNSITGYKVKKI